METKVGQARPTGGEDVVGAVDPDPPGGRFDRAGEAKVARARARQEKNQSRRDRLHGSSLASTNRCVRKETASSARARPTIEPTRYSAPRFQRSCKNTLPIVRTRTTIAAARVGFDRRARPRSRRTRAKIPQASE